MKKKLKIIAVAVALGLAVTLVVAGVLVTIPYNPKTSEGITVTASETYVTSELGVEGQEYTVQEDSTITICVK